MEETWSQEDKISQLNHVWASVELHDKRLCLSKEMRWYEVMHKHMHTWNDLYNTYHNCQKEQLTMAIVWRQSPACVQCSVVCLQCISNSEPTAYCCTFISIRLTFTFTDESGKLRIQHGSFFCSTWFFFFFNWSKLNIASIPTVGNLNCPHPVLIHKNPKFM